MIKFLVLTAVLFALHLTVTSYLVLHDADYAAAVVVAAQGGFLTTLGIKVAAGERRT